MFCLLSLPPAWSRHHHPFLTVPLVTLATQPPPHYGLVLSTEVAQFLENLSHLKPTFHSKLSVAPQFTQWPPPGLTVTEFLLFSLLFTVFQLHSLIIPHTPQ